MRKRELNSKSDIEKKDELFQARPTYTGSELGGDKLEDYFQQISPESSPERLLSILTSPEFSQHVNASRKVDIINQLHQTYGNRHLQRMIQAKLKINQPNDKYEQEADRLADEVMRMPGPAVPQQHVKEEIQAKGASDQGSEVSSHLEDSIQSLKGGGKPLSESERAFFEPRFGYNFSMVRVHNGDKADKLNRELNAKAFTTGNDIFFRNGEYHPDCIGRRKLMTHELIHVIQQSGENIDWNLNINLPRRNVEQNFIKMSRFGENQQLIQHHFHQSSSPIIQRQIVEVVTGSAVALGVAADIITLFAGEIRMDKGDWIRLRQIGPEIDEGRIYKKAIVEVANRERIYFDNLKIFYLIDYIFEGGILNAHARPVAECEASDHDEGTIKIVDEKGWYTKKDDKGRQLPVIEFNLQVNIDPVWEDKWSDEFSVKIIPGEEIDVYQWGPSKYIKEAGTMKEYGPPVVTPEKARRKK